MDEYRITCRRCGTYFATHEFVFLNDKDRMQEVGFLLSGFSREINEIKEKYQKTPYPEFTTKSVDNFKNDYLFPSVDSLDAKASKLIERLRDKTEYFGEDIELGDKEEAYPLAYSKNSSEFIALLDLLQAKMLVTHTLTNHGNYFSVKARLLADGWTLAHESKNANQESKQGFIAVWFDDSMDKSIKAIEEAIQESGYTPLCINNEHFPERIIDKALGEIRKSKFVVVDLTGERGSVFFEAGFASGLGIETFYVYQENKKTKNAPLEFYARHYKCYRYKTFDDLKAILKDAIQARLVIKNK